MEHPSVIVTALTLLAVGLAAYTDMRAGRIPNYITFTAILVGLAVGALERGLPGLVDSALGLVAGVAFLIIPFALGGIGPGDVKLLAAVGSLNGLAFATRAFLYTAVTGGLVAGFLMIAAHTAVGTALGGLFAFLRMRGGASLHKSFPYGLAILAGTALAYTVR